MTTRRWLVPVSLSAHLAAGLGLYAAGIWKIERVEAAHASTDIRPPFPVAAPEGGGKIVAQKTNVEAKAIPKVITQPVPTVMKPLHPDTSEAQEPGSGSGSAVGPGSGSGDPLSHGDCTGDDCTKIPTPPDPPKLPVNPDPVTKPPLVPESKLPQFVSGDRDIHPPDTVITSMSRDGKTKTTGTFKFCLDTNGSVTGVAMLRSTGFDIYDQRINAAMRGWRYQAFLIDGKPTPVCSVATFVFTIR